MIDRESAIARRKVDGHWMIRRRLSVLHIVAGHPGHNRTWTCMTLGA